MKGGSVRSILGAGYSEAMPSNVAAQDPHAAERSLRDYRSADLVQAGGARGLGRGLRMTARLRTIGAVTLGRVEGLGGEIERLDVAKDPVSYDITYVMQGGFDYFDGGSWHPLGGVVKLAPTGLPSRLRLNGRSSFVFARIERSRLLSRVVDLPRTFHAYRRKTLADQALIGLIGSVLGEEAEPTAWERRLLERSIVDLAGGIVRGRLGQPSTARSPHDAIREQARLLIAQRAGDPSFSSRDIAEEIGISLRQLQAIFTRSGSTPIAEIRLERTRLAHGLLVDPAHDRLSLVQISRRAGFGSIDSMRRALKERYGAGPNRLRTERS